MSCVFILVTAKIVYMVYTMRYSTLFLTYDITNVFCDILLDLNKFVFMKLTFSLERNLKFAYTD